MKKLRSLPELRDAVWDWVREFRDEGPYAEDVEALGKYLKRVVGEEGDMGKAVAVAKWLGWVLGEEFEDVIVGTGDAVNGRAREKWKGAFENVKLAVLSAVKERGLGSVEF
jgi:DNA repair protein REV1